MYIELLDLKANLGIDSTTDDTLLERAIYYSKNWIDSFCLRTFEASADSVRKFDAIRQVQGRVLLLDRDLCAITSVVNGDGTTVLTTQYTTLPYNESPWWGLSLKSSTGLRWTFTTDSEGAISITGRWAYSIVAPEAIKMASIRLASYLYRIKDAQVFDVTAMSEIGAIKIDKRMPKDVQEVLSAYRRAVGTR